MAVAMQPKRAVPRLDTTVYSTVGHLSLFNIGWAVSFKQNEVYSAESSQTYCCSVIQTPQEIAL